MSDRGFDGSGPIQVSIRSEKVKVDGDGLSHGPFPIRANQL